MNCILKKRLAESSSICSSLELRPLLLELNELASLITWVLLLVVWKHRFPFASAVWLRVAAVVMAAIVLTCVVQLKREKVELENALEQEQEALVNRLWKQIDRLEAEKRWACFAKIAAPYG